MMENSVESQRLRRPRSRTACGFPVSTIIVTIFGLLLVFGIVQSYLTLQIDPQGCKTPSMLPTYIKLGGFDTEHTRFASKYNLYLYRERGVDDYSEEDIGLKGVPVLFLPGNAGSYRQGRSLASEASLYFHNVLQHDQDRVKVGTRSLDFFMADFNEDMAAFHGQTILDQAECINDALSYILSLYHDPNRARRDTDLPDPVSVILIGHSMGGIVARTVLTMANYQANSVNSIITMSTPHARPPVSFDSDLMSTYKQINSYWREAYSERWANNNPLWHVTLISIAGGGGDTIVPSDYTSLSSLVPDTHGFTVFTSTIPNVWTGVDHLSIAWCDSFRKAVVRALFDVIDVRRATQTKQRAERMSIFRKWFLTGIEPNADKLLPSKEPTTLLTLEENANAMLKQGERLVLRGLGHHEGPKAHLIPVPPRGGVPGKKFTLLTDQRVEPSGSGKLEILFCSDPPSRAGQSATLLSLNLDLSGGNAASPRLVCKSSYEDVINIPASNKNSKAAFDDAQPFSYFQYSLEDLTEYQFVAIVDKHEKATPGFLIAEFSDSSDSVIPTRVSLGRLLSAGLTILLPADRPMVTDIKVPALRSSLLAYKLKLNRQGCKPDSELFAPIVRQYISDPYESKFFVNVKAIDVNLHGVAPYMPPHIRENAAGSGVSFELWSDRSCSAPLQISLQVDVLGSLGRLAMRYRTVFAAFPLVIVAMVLRKQFRVYDQTGVFINFSESLELCIRSSLPLTFLGFSLLATTLATSKSVVTQGVQSSWQSNATETPIDYGKNDLLLGSQDTFFWFLVPLFGIISVGACVVVHYAATTIIYLLGLLRSTVAAQQGYIKHENGKTAPLLWSLSTRHRIVNAVILLFLVATVIPYQFAYVVACIVQLITCVQASSHARETRSGNHANLSNFAHSILILMLWILPINIPVLIVWGHNLAVHWFTPFSSHHNVLSIMPFILLVETLTTGAMIPRVTSNFKHITSGLFFFLAVYAAIYGVTYAYLLHHIANFVVTWLVVLYLFGNGLYIPSIDRITRLPDFADTDFSNGHIKKLP
ncbi:GPI inositol-deacylase [Trichophyton violaceum]|uniref:GPI inositol-deacylase n=1 Tax=Trichophyton violaceum TaxID=34388 RepID=A0A178FKT2_TRIVO|nr:GPI inositol-deacylase [Trichophyton violaceum]